jgi:hypothetical protein
MISIGILERDDVIRGDDWVRYMEIEYVGQSDTVMTRSTYGGSPLNFFRWMTVKDAQMFHFIGKKLGYVEDWLDSIERPSQPVARWEFARGPIPESHTIKAEDHG